MARLEQEIAELKQKEDSLRDMIQNKQFSTFEVKNTKVSNHHSTLTLIQSAKFSSSYKPEVEDPAIQSKYNYLLAELE